MNLPYASITRHRKTLIQQPPQSLLLMDIEDKPRDYHQVTILSTNFNQTCLTLG